MNTEIQNTEILCEYLGNITMSRDTKMNRGKYIERHIIITHTIILVRFADRIIACSVRSFRLYMKLNFAVAISLWLLEIWAIVRRDFKFYKTVFSHVSLLVEQQYSY